MARDLKQLSRRELEDLLTGLGHAPWRVDEIRRWIYRRGATTFSSFSSLPLPLREALASEYYLFLPKVTGIERAGDGTAKFVLALEDGSPCEAVLIPEGTRITLCLSSQSGCPLACSFCLTGSRGLKRNLAVSEIADQWLTARRHLAGKGRITNLVYMGMGEPLLNFDSLLGSIEIFTSPWGGELSPSRITVSTAGVVPGIDRLAQEMPAVNLAISLNAPEDTLRDRLMPLNRKYPIAELMESLRRYPSRRRPLTIEYVLLKDVNDSPDLARKLAGLLRGLRCKINLIPFNPHSGLPFTAPEAGVILQFQDILRRAGYSAPVRRSKGVEIAAACGQLGGPRGNMRSNAAKGGAPPSTR